MLRNRKLLIPNTTAFCLHSGRDFRTLAAYQDGSPARVHSLATQTSISSLSSLGVACFGPQSHVAPGALRRREDEHQRLWPAKDSHETLGCQLTNVPFGFSFQ